MQLTHKDVVLDFFKDKKEVVFQLKSGIPLFLTDAYLSAEMNGRSVRIAKLSKACRERLQTLPDNYTKVISNTQRYKSIGNGWTVDVIAHIFSFMEESGEVTYSQTINLFEWVKLFRKRA